MAPRCCGYVEGKRGEVRDGWERGGWGGRGGGGGHANGSVPVVERAVFYVLVFGIEMLVFIVSYCKQAHPRHWR